MGRWLRCVSGEAASIKANESASNTESLVQFKHLTKFGYIPADFMGCGGRCRVDSAMVVVGGKGESMDKRPIAPLLSTWYTQSIPRSQGPESLCQSSPRLVSTLINLCY